MKTQYIIITFFAMLSFSASGQRLFTAGITYTGSAPAYNPGATGSRVAIDTTTFDVYLYKSGTTWEKAGRGIDEVTGCVKPTYTPSKFDANIAVSMTCDSIWRYRSGVWYCANCPQPPVAYSAGTGINITGTTITNTGDLSNTNELQTLSTGTNTLTLSNSGGTVTVDTDPTTDITTSTTANGDLSGTYPNPTVDGLQGRALSATAPTTGQVLKWSGTQWQPGVDNDAPTGTLNQTLRHNGTSWAAVSNLRVPNTSSETAANMIWMKDAHNNVFINKNSSSYPLIVGSQFTTMRHGSFSLNSLHLPEFNDILNVAGHWTKTTSGSNAAGGNTYIINYAINPNTALINPAQLGLSYTSGTWYFGFYGVWRPASLSLRMKKSDGTWLGPFAIDVTQGSNADPNYFPVYTRSFGGFANWITDFEITMVTRTDVQTSVEFIYFIPYDAGDLQGGGLKFFNKALANERLYSGIEFGNSSGVVTSKITNSGNIYFANSTGNVGIGTSTPSASAKLDITSTSSGVLFPRMTTTQRDAISSPTDGLVIFNTSTSKLQVRAGGAWADLH